MISCSRLGLAVVLLSGCYVLEPAPASFPDPADPADDDDSAPVTQDDDDSAAPQDDDDAVLDDQPYINRAFWRGRLKAAIESLDTATTPQRIHDIVRIVATSFQTPKADRDVLIATLIECRVRVESAA